MPLVAYNINLSTPSLEIAHDIAKKIRFIGGGLRYCMNSAALRFVPRSRMAEEDTATGFRLWMGMSRHEHGEYCGRSQARQA